MSRQISKLIEVEEGRIEVFLQGEGPLVVMIPSLGRGAEDFDRLSGAVARAGYQAVSPQPRGIGRTQMPLDGMSMADLASDIAQIVSVMSSEKAVLIGHAMGNRIARVTATNYPDNIDSVILLACGGLVPMSLEANKALLGVFDVEASPSEHIEHVRKAFFADGNDPKVWSDGWNEVVADFQLHAVRNIDVSDWWTAGSCPVLVVQPEEDVIAVPENAYRIVAELGNRATLELVPQAGHALLPEQPEILEEIVLRWLTGRELL